MDTLQAWRRRHALIAALQRGEDVPTMLELVARPAWHARAACHGMTETFFPTRGQSDREAKALCATCPVQAQCRADALERPQVEGVPLSGIWGGLSQRERRKLRRTANADAA